MKIAGTRVEPETLFTRGSRQRESKAKGFAAC
jgi:hypothetical protein